jgi:predicted MFS family arabinose efflux permease
VYSLVVSGSTPLGNLFAGAVSERFGTRAGFTICGALIVVLLLALLALQKRKTEPET